MINRSVHHAAALGNILSQVLLREFDDAIESELRNFEDRRCNGELQALSEMFCFIREVKWLVGEYLCDSEGFAIMGKVLRMRSPEAEDPWAETFPEHADPALDFHRAWDLVQFPVGMLDRAVALAKGRPLPVISGVSARYDFFLALCVALQQLRGEGREFFLTQTAVGAALGVSQRMISTYISLAKRHGFLRETQPAIAKRRSTYFLFSLATSTKVPRVSKVSKDKKAANVSKFDTQPSKKDFDFEREEIPRRDYSRFDAELDAIGACVGVDRKGRREQWLNPDGPEAA